MDGSFDDVLAVLIAGALSVTTGFWHMYSRVVERRRTYREYETRFEMRSANRQLEQIDHGIVTRREALMDTYRHSDDESDDEDVEVVELRGDNRVIARQVTKVPFGVRDMRLHRNPVKAHACDYCGTPYRAEDVQDCQRCGAPVTYIIPGTGAAPLPIAAPDWTVR